MRHVGLREGSLSFSLRQGLLLAWSLPNRLGWLAAALAIYLAPPLWHGDCKGVHTIIPIVFKGSGDLTCKESALLTEPLTGPMSIIRKCTAHWQCCTIITITCAKN